MWIGRLAWEGQNPPTGGCGEFRFRRGTVTLPPNSEQLSCLLRPPTMASSSTIRALDKRHVQGYTETSPEIFGLPRGYHWKVIYSYDACRRFEDFYCEENNRTAIDSCPRCR